MRIVRLDTELLARTNASGYPLHCIIEEEIAEIEMITDANGNPTKGGVIGYALAYVVMAGFIGYFFYFIP